MDGFEVEWNAFVWMLVLLKMFLICYEVVFKIIGSLFESMDGRIEDISN